MNMIRILGLAISFCTFSIVLFANNFNEEFNSIKEENPDNLFARITFLSQYYVENSNELLNSQLIEEIVRNKKSLTQNSEDYYTHEIACLIVFRKKNMVSNALKIIGDLEKDKNLAVNYEVLYSLFSGTAGNLYTFLNEYPRALSYYERVYNLSVDLADTFAIQSALCNIGKIYADQEEWSAAKKYFLESQAFEDQGYTEFSSYILGSLAVVYRSEGDFDLAERTFLKILSDTIQSNWGGVHVNLGGLYLEKGDYQNAEKMLKIGLRKGKINNDFYVQGNAYHVLVDLYELKGDYKKALLYQKLEDSVSALTLNDNTAEIIDSVDNSNFNHLLESERKDAQNKLNAASLQKRVAIYSFVIVFILLFLVTYWLIRVRRKNNRLVQENLDSMNQDSLKISDHVQQSNGAFEINEGLLQKLQVYLIEEKNYLDSSITLDRLAKKIGSNSKDVSELINNHFDMPFRSLLNMLRIKDAKRLLAKSDMNHYSIEGISSMVGYRNLSTFNRNFKNETGLTPSYFQSRSQTILKKTSR